MRPAFAAPAADNALRLCGMCRRTGRGRAREVAELVCVLVVVGKGECAEVEVDACAVCGVVLGPFE